MNEWRVANRELEAGMAALRAGRRMEARSLLAQAVRADPGDVTAWLGLSRCLDDEGQRRECLRRALRLDPANEAVRRALGLEAGSQLRRIVGNGGSGELDVRSAPELQSRSSPIGVGRNPQPVAKGSEEPVIERGPAVAAARQPLTASQTAPAASDPLVSRRNAWRRLVLLALAVVLVALAWMLAPRLGALSLPAPSVGDVALTASGVIRADEVFIASEWGGQIAAIPVREGDAVASGDVIVRLDTSLLDAQIEVARAAIAVAEAGVAQAKAGARPGQIAVAEAQLVQAEAARAAATQAVSDTLALVENPQDVRLQIAVAQAQASAAEHHLARAVAIKDAAEIGKDKFEEVQGQSGRQKVLVRSGPLSELLTILPPEIVDNLPPLGDGVYTFGDFELHIQGGTYRLYRWLDVHIPFELHLMPNRWWQGWVGVNAAVAQKEGLEASLAHLYAKRAHPQELEAKADEALAVLAQAEAQVLAAQAQVEGLKAGATEEQIAALEARVAQAQAAVDALLTQRAMMDITSPVSGTVMSVMAHPGEVAAPGTSLLTVSDLSQVKLIVYVPQNRLGQVQLEQRAQITVDSFPGQVFEGEVAYIADRAEFTPRNVATKEERVNLVFAVEIRVANKDGALKPGMPADVVFGN
jgi:multidrug resistance efflux pump